MSTGSDLADPAVNGGREALTAASPVRSHTSGWRAWAYRTEVSGGAGAAHAVSLIAALAVLTYYGARQWFFTDDWEFIVRNLPGPSRLGLFVPHNEHWSTIPLLVYKTLFAVFALRTYLPYELFDICLHVLAAHLLWRLALRVGANPWTATALAATFLALGMGYEQILSAFQATFELSLCCGLAWLLVTDSGMRERPRVVAGWVLGVAASMSSGIALPMIAVVALATAGRRGLRSAAVAVSVPVAVNVAWYLAIRPQQTLPATGHALLLLPAFVARGLTATANGAVGLWWTGTALLVVLLGWMLRRWRVLPPIAWSGVVGSFILFAIVGLGRVALGVEQATTSRYLYLAAALLMPTVALALTAAARRRLLWQAAVLGLVAVSTAHGAVVLFHQFRQQTAVRAADRDIVMAAATVISSGTQVLGGQADPIYGPDIDLADLRTLVATGALRVTPPAPLSILTVESRIEVSVSDEPVLSGAPPLLRVVQGMEQGAGQCTRLIPGASGSARVQLIFSAPASVAIAPAGAGTVVIVLSAADHPGLAAPPTAVTVGAGQREFLNISAPQATPTLTLPGGAVLCGVSS
ncbi:MAG: hypothetical protein M3R48_02530 [Candidatus Dormibacteraeota bacterium]|nr:hypothetical protein [Candidatus Dormibacteraeota bacterium]